MKKLLSMVLTLTLLMSSLTALAAVTKPASLPETGVVFADDFEGYTSGDSEPNTSLKSNWGYSGNSMSLGEENGNKYASALNAYYYGSTQFPAGTKINSGKLKIDVDVRITDSMTTGDGNHIITYSQWGGTSDDRLYAWNAEKTDDGAKVYWSKGRHIAARPTATDADAVSDLTLNTWHTISIVVDYNEKTRSYYLDDNLVLTITDATRLNFIDLGICKSGSSANIDNVKIERLKASTEVDDDPIEVLSEDFNYSSTDALISGTGAYVVAQSADDSEAFARRDDLKETVIGKSSGYKNGSIVFNQKAGVKYQSLVIPFQNGKTITKGKVNIQFNIWPAQATTPSDWNLGFGLHDTTRTATSYDWNSTWADATLFAGLTPWSRGVSFTFQNNRFTGGRSQIPGYYAETGGTAQSTWNDNYNNGVYLDMGVDSGAGQYYTIFIEADLDVGTVTTYIQKLTGNKAQTEKQFAYITNIDTQYTTGANYDAFVISGIDGNIQNKGMLYIDTLRVTNEIRPEEMSAVKIMNGASELDVATITGTETLTVTFDAPAAVNGKKANVIIASYVGEELTGIVCDTDKTVKAGTNSFDLTINDKFAGANTVKAFIFTNFDEMYPLTDAAVYTK